MTPPTTEQRVRIAVRAKPDLMRAIVRASLEQAGVHPISGRIPEAGDCRRVGV